jgi:hypothetical protein
VLLFIEGGLILNTKTAQVLTFNSFSGITGSYVNEEQAAKAHDLAALKYWGTGPNTKLNFNVRITCCLALIDIC